MDIFAKKKRNLVPAGDAVLDLGARLR